MNIFKCMSITVLSIVMTATMAIAQEEKPIQTAGQVSLEEVKEEQQALSLKLRYLNKQVLAVMQEAEQSIQVKLRELQNLTDRTQEPELQKEIEHIKQDAEIARLTIILDIAKKQEQLEVVNQIQQEIKHLAEIEEPTTGEPLERPEISVSDTKAEYIKTPDDQP